MTPLLHKKLATLLILALLPGLILAQLRGDTYSTARQSKAAKFYYVYDGVPGFVDQDANGEVKGLLVDIMQKFEDYLRDTRGISVSVEFVQVPNKDFKIFMSDIKDGSGGVFGLSNVSIREERKKDYKFSPPYISNVSVLISNAKTPTLTNLGDLSARFSGKKAYSVSSSTYYARLDELRQAYYPDMEIISLPSVNEVMAKVSTDNDAFGVVDLNYYLQALKEKTPIKRHSIGDKGEDRFGVIMPLRNDWEPLIKDFFNNGFIGGPEYRLIISEHLGKGALRLIEGTN